MDANLHTAGAMKMASWPYICWSTNSDPYSLSQREISEAVMVVGKSRPRSELKRKKKVDLAKVMLSIYHNKFLGLVYFRKVKSFRYCSIFVCL